MLDNKTVARIANSANSRDEANYFRIHDAIHNSKAGRMFYLGAVYKIAYAQGKHDERARKKRPNAWSRLKELLFREERGEKCGKS